MLLLLVFYLIFRFLQIFNQTCNSVDFCVALRDKLLDRLVVQEALNHRRDVIFVRLVARSHIFDSAEHAALHTFELASKRARLDFAIESDAHIFRLVDPLYELILHVLDTVVLTIQVVNVRFALIFLLLLGLLLHALGLNDLFPVDDALARSDHHGLVRQALLLRLSLLLSPLVVSFALLLRLNQFPKPTSFKSELIAFRDGDALCIVVDVGELRQVIGSAPILLAQPVLDDQVALALRCLDAWRTSLSHQRQTIHAYFLPSVQLLSLLGEQLGVLLFAPFFLLRYEYFLLAEFGHLEQVELPGVLLDQLVECVFKLFGFLLTVSFWAGVKHSRLASLIQ